MSDFDDFGLLAQMARRQLIHILEMMPETKDLAVEPSLMRPLDKIASMSLLQQHNCARVQQFNYSIPLVWSEQSLRRVYIVRPSIMTVRFIAQQICADNDHRYSIVFIPNKSCVCELELEMNGVFGLIDVYDLDLPLISLDSHLFSLEHPNIMASLLVDRTYKHIRSVAKSIWQLQSLYGLIPTIYGVGSNSVNVNSAMKKLYAEMGEPRASPDQPISHLFLLDRNLDLTTVLLTGLTYESMLNDTFNISCGKVTFGERVEKKLRGSDKNRSKITVLDNNDALFSTIRNMHMTAVFPFLSAKAKSLQASYNKGAQFEQVKDMKDFVSNELKTMKRQHQLLELHICACEVVLENCKGMAERLNFEHSLVAGNFEINDLMSFLENSMCQQTNQWQVLLLACLWSVCSNGIITKYFHSLRAQFLRAYGYEYLPLLSALSTRGLLIERVSPQLTSMKMLSLGSSTSSQTATNRPTFQFLSRKMNLLPVTNQPAVNLQNPDQMRYVFSGAYTPALCQIVEDTVNNGWNTVEMKKTFGDSVFCDENSYTSPNRPLDSRIRKAIFVYFVGGVTYAEVAALTLLAQHNNFRIIIAATNIINRENFIKEMANAAV